MKTEPSTWSWNDQVKAGAKGTAWDGVRNHIARKNLKAMKKGDRAFFYHTGEEKQVVGIVEIIGEYRPDPSDETGVFGLVEVRAKIAMAKPVTLATCRTEPRLKNMVLLHNSRLSVQQVADTEWKVVCALGETKSA